MTTRKEAALILTISAVLLLGLLVYLLWRYANLSAWHAAVCVLFGYFLASSSLAPHITRWLRSAAAVIAGWNP